MSKDNDRPFPYDFDNHIDREFVDCRVAVKVKPQITWPCPMCGCMLDDSMPYCPCCDI